MYSREGLLDLKNEKYVVSIFYLSGAQPPLSLLLFWSICPQGTNSSYSAWGPSISCLSSFRMVGFGVIFPHLSSLRDQHVPTHLHTPL